MSPLVQIGLCVLALGTLLGWPMALHQLRPDALRRLGVKSPRRLLQMHIDVVIMGLILVAVGVAVPDLPGWIAAPLVAGAIVNPALFLPLAFREEWTQSGAYRTVSVLSFAAMSFGTVGAAWFALAS